MHRTLVSKWWTVLLAGMLHIGGVHGQAVTPPRDLQLLGRALGPLPIRPGVDSRFVLTVSNSGPNATVAFTRTIAIWPLGLQRLEVVGLSPPPCRVLASDPADPPLAYSLDVIVTTPIAPGESVACEFVLRTNLPLEPDATLTFTTYDDRYSNSSDPDFSNNSVSFGIGAPLNSAIPALSPVALTLLAAMLAVVTLVLHRRERRRGRVDA